MRKISSNESLSAEASTYIYLGAFVTDGPSCAIAEIVEQASWVQVVVDSSISFCFSSFQRLLEVR